MTATGDLRALHGLRAVAALTVLVAHCEPLLGFGFVGNSGSVGVILFFILSGFLMPHVYMGQKAAPRVILDYARNRFARVYPLFALTVIGSAILYSYYSDFPFRLDLGETIQHLVLAGDGLTLWTISVEFQFYLLFIGLWCLRTWFSDDALCALLLLIVAGLMFSGFAEGRIAPGLYMHIFAIGMLAEQVYRRVRLPKPDSQIWGLMALLLVGAYFLGFVCWTRYFGGLGMYEQVWFAGLIACLVIVVSRSPHIFVTRALSHPIAVALGTWSFGIYLLHRPVYWMLDRILGDYLTGYVEFAVGLALTILISALAYQFVELPARKLLRAPVRDR